MRFMKKILSFFFFWKISFDIKKNHFFFWEKFIVYTFDSANMCMESNKCVLDCVYEMNSQLLYNFFSLTRIFSPLKPNFIENGREIKPNTLVSRLINFFYIFNSLCSCNLARKKNCELVLTFVLCTHCTKIIIRKMW